MNNLLPSIDILTKPHAADPFLQDTLDLFKGNKSGHMNSYAFNQPDPDIPNDPVRGGEYWSRMIDYARDYYLITKEPEVISYSSTEITKYLPSCISAVELGPGEKTAVYEKTLPFLKSFVQISDFTAVDVNSDFASGASSIVSKKMKIPTRPVVGNFFDEELRLTNRQTTVFSLFGGLLCNFELEKGKAVFSCLQQKFLDLSLNIKARNYLAITQDTNQNEESLLKAYSHPFMGAYILSVLHKIKRDLPTQGFNSDAFRFCVSWDKKNHLLKLGACLKENHAPQSFELAGHNFTLFPGQELTLVNSYKFPVPFFLTAAEKAGFIPLKTVKCKNNPIALHLLQKAGPFSIHSDREN